MDKDKKTVTPEKMLLSNMYEIEAVISLLEKKGILTHAEVLEEIKSMVAEQDKKKAN